MNFTKKSLLVTLLISLLVFTSLMVAAQDSEPTEDSEPTVLATVNGEDITDQELSSAAQVYPIIMTLSQQYRSFAQFLISSPAGSEFLSEYRKYVLDQLIDEKLKQQKVEEMDIGVSDEEVQAEIDNIIENNEQFGDEQALEDYLKNEQNMSMDNLKSMIKENLRSEKLTEEVTSGVEVSEEEVKAYYESNEQSFTDDEGNVKPFEEVEGQIESNLLSEKENQVYNEWMEKVREEAEVTKNEENLNEENL
ncbi:MAG: SurA N-terminal domain-containing protein [Candidatus Bipolaricaulota bacterium]